MSHEDTLLMIEAIKSVAGACGDIMRMILVCTMMRVLCSLYVAKFKCTS